MTVKSAERSEKVEGREAPAAEASAVHLVYGEDEYQVSLAAHRIVDGLCPDPEKALGLEVVDGQAGSAADAVQAINRCLDAVRTVGFFGGRKVVWLKGADFFIDTPIGRSEEVKSRAQGLAEEIKKGLASGQWLVISAPKVDGRSAFFKACKAHGQVHSFSLPEKDYQREDQARDWARAVFREKDLKAREEVLDAFLEKAGFDSRQIIQEAEKLALYLHDRHEVTLDDVRRIVSAAREALAWDLTDAIGTRDLPESLRVLRQLFFQKESDVGILVAVENRVRELLVLRACLDRGWLRVSGSERWRKPEWRADAELEAALASMKKDPRQLHPFRAVKLIEQAERFTEKELVRFQLEALAAHEQLVTSSLPGELILEYLILRWLGRAPAERKQG